jgi:phosphoesterase RecJ-like protein
MIRAEQYREAMDVMRGWDRVWIIAHAHADGDAIGSLIGARAGLRTVARDVTAFVFEPITRRYEFLVADDPLQVWDDESAKATRPDGLVLVDTCSRSQIEPFHSVLDSLSAPIVVFDHHKTRDIEAAVGLFDESAAAASLLIAEWAEANEITFDHATNLALFAGLSSDTGWFRYENADRRAFETAGRMIERGVHPDELYRRLYCTDRPQRLAMLARIFDTLELHADGRIATAYYTQEMMKKSGAKSGDLEELVSEIGRIGSIVTWALFSEQEDGRVRVNLRSKDTVDVAALAARLGGGGHARAAGARMSGSIEDAKLQIVRELTADLGEHTDP